MPNGLVSVVIPVFNGEKFVAEAVESVRQQTYEPIETIVVDDVSTDASAEIAEDLGTTLIRRAENGGCAAARNSGIENARGDYITILDCDDLMTPDRIEKQVNAIKDGADFVLTLYELDIAPGVEPPDLVTAKRGEISEGLDISLTTSWLASREAVERIGLFDESLRWGEDVDYCMRATDAGLNVVHLDERLTIRRIHGENMIYDFQSARRAVFDAFKRRIDRKRAARTP